MNQLPKVSLSTICSEMLPTMLLWRNDPRVFKWCRQYEPISETSHLNWFNGLLGDNSRKMYSILNDQNDLVGICGLTSIDWVNRRAEFSLYIDPAKHGTGLGHSALIELIKVGFNNLNLNSIWGESFDGNPATRTFEKIGFKLEGLRRSFYYRDGKYINATLWSLLKDEYLH